MKIKSKYVVIMLFSLVVLCASTITTTLAWFLSNYNSTTTDISGSVLESYFDKAFTYSGDPGTETNPYVITTPRHYENLVKLYTQKFYNPVTKQYEYFSDKDYHFEVGKQMQKDGEYFVYDYDDFGAYEGTTSKVLNLKSLSSVEPIGNDAHPFNSTILGHNIKIDSFTVKASSNSSQGYNDIGIFGFVKTKARCQDIYWDNFLIDASGAKIMSHTDAEAAAHNDNFRIGYIAGHIKTYESFTNCYVNNCYIKSPSVNYVQQDEYGYYGMVEKDKTGTGLPEGKNYSYTFDSQVWQQYFNTNLSTISGQTLAMRNTVEGENSPNNEIILDGETFGSAITKGTLLSSYYINGKSLDNSSYTGRNFSLSTMGYVGGELIPSSDTRTCVYPETDGSSTYLNCNNNAKMTYDNIYDNPGSGTYYKWDSTNNKWQYYYCNNHKTVDGERLYLDFEFSSSREYMWGNVKSEGLLLEFILYFDNDTTPKIITGKGEKDGRYVKWTCDSDSIDVPIGAHYFCMMCHKKYKVYNTWHEYYYKMYGTMNTSQKTVGMEQLCTNNTDSNGRYTDYTYHGNRVMLTNHTNPFDIHLSNYELFGTYIEDATPTIHYGGACSEIPVGSLILGSSNFIRDMYCKNSSGTVFQMKNTDSDKYDTAEIKKSGSYLVVVVTTVIIDPSTSTKHYIADDPSVSTEDNKYNYRCIDVVGGGVGFYYYSSLFFGQIKITRITSEGASASNTIVKEVTSDDIGKKFYAPGRTNQSLVLYVRNVGSAIDEIDDYMGSVSFNYYQLGNTVTYLGMHTCHPAYKKGASSTSSNYYEFTDIHGEPSYSGTNNTLCTYSDLEIKESFVKRMSYCCLDGNGKILGAYNADGSNRIGMTRDAEKRIETYVIVIGSFTNSSVANWHLWLRDVHFEYKAAAGEGGTFGSVGYRSQGDSLIEDTIINFHIDSLDANVQYMVLVVYTESDKTYRITVKSDTSFDMKFYNYFPSTYALIVNNTPITDKSYTITIPKSSTSYPNFT